MLVIRLARKGRRNHPTYRITVAEHTKPTNGKFVEVVGHYSPVAESQPLEVKKDRVDYWMSQGAQVSNTVAKLLNKVGYDLPVIQKNKPAKKEAVKEEKKVEQPVAEGEKPESVEDAPQEEAKPEEKPTEPEAKEEPVKEEKPEEPKVEEASEEKPTEE